MLAPSRFLVPFLKKQDSSDDLDFGEFLLEKYMSHFEVLWRTSFDTFVVFFWELDFGEFSVPRGERGGACAMIQDQK